MVTMPQLRDADPALFSDAADAWERWAKRYDGYAQEFDDEVDPRLKHWRGALLGMLSDALAASTDPNNPFWTSDDHYEGFLDHLKQQGRSMDHELPGGNDFSGYWGLGQIMAADNHPPYSTQFLDEVGRDMVAWDKARSENNPHWPASAGPYDSGLVGSFNQPGTSLDRAGTASDPLLGLLHAASTNPEGAQRVIGMDGNLDYLLDNQRSRWGESDHGDALGEALEAAASGQDDASKRIAAQSVDILADDIREYAKADGQQLTFDGDPNALSGLRDSMGNILAAHIDDVNGAILSGSEDPGGDYLVGEDQSHAAFGVQDLACVLTDVELDDSTYETLIRAQTGYMSHEIDQAADSGSLEQVVNQARQGGHVLGFMVEAHAQGAVAAGRDADEVSHALADAVRKGAGLIPPPPAPGGSAIARYGYGAAADWIGRQIETQHELEAFEDVRTDRQAKDALINQLVERTMVEHHLYGDPPKGDRSFEENGEIMPVAKMVADEDKYKDFHDWIQDTGNPIIGTKMDVREQRSAGYDDFRDRTGLQR